MPATIPVRPEAPMDLLEVESTQNLTREQAAEVLRQMADTLARHSQVEFSREGLRYIVDVTDNVELEVEIEIGDNNSLEIEIN